MVKALGTWGRMLHAALAAVWLAVAVLAAPAFAAPAGPDVPAWLARTTDLPAAQIAIVGPESVYSLEPMGPRLPTGEVIVLVRTEALADDWGAAHGFQSWDANLLIDCASGRMRVIRSAAYPQRNRQGRATPEAVSQEMVAPKAGEPAAWLVAAACDPGFDWPLRTTLAAAADPQKAADLPATPRLAEFRSTPTPAAAQPIAPQFAVQLARGPSEDGARRAVDKARKTLGLRANRLTGATPLSWISGERRRYTALLGGFSAQADAQAACAALKRAKQDCYVRGGPAVSLASLTAAPDPPATAARPPAAAATYLVQIARGPSEDGARRALAKARRTLGPLARGLMDAMPMSEIGGNRRRYDVRLEGFRSADAAGAACRKLAVAGQSCFTRTVTAGSA